MRAVGFIPARMASTRFPGKPLAAIGGKPMLQHCYDGAVTSELLDEVIVATCDAEIARWADAAGIRSIMTSDAHERATDRVAEAAGQVEDADAIVLIQGDEPMVTRAMVDAALQPVLDGRAECTNLMKRIQTAEELESPNLVKVVVDRRGFGLYLSRSPLPSPVLAGFDGIAGYNQVAVFGFTRERLFEFAELEPTPCEIAESVDMLRYLEHGRDILFVETTDVTHAVDVPDDIAAVEAMLAR